MRGPMARVARMFLVAALATATLAPVASAADPVSGAVFTDHGFGFHAVRPDGSTTGFVSIRNDGDAEGAARSVEFTGPDAAAFSPEHANINWGLGANGSYGGFPVDFAPDTLGWKHATMVMVYDTDAWDGIDATATLRVDIEALATNTPTGVTASSADVGPVQQGDWASGTVRLTNSAETDVTIGDIGPVSGIVVRQLTDDGCSGVTLEAGEHCDIDYRLRSDSIGRQSTVIGVRPAYPFLQSTVHLYIDVTPNPSYPDDLKPKMVRLDQPVPVSLDFSGTKPRITLRMSWLATDERAIGGYQLDVSKGTEDHWVSILDQQPPFPAPPKPATSQRHAITPGLLYTRVRARDTAGNTSSWKTEGTHYGLTDMARATTTGTWTTVAASGKANGGSLRQAKKAGASATLRIAGRMFALVGRTSADSGKVQIWVDGTKRLTVDLHSATTRDHQVLAVFTGEANRAHSVKVVTQANSGRTKVALDAWVTGD